MFKFKFSEQMTNDIAAALGNVPYRVAAPIIAEMQRQIEVQQKPTRSIPGGSAIDGKQQLSDKNGKAGSRAAERNG